MGEEKRGELVSQRENTNVKMLNTDEIPCTEL